MEAELGIRRHSAAGFEDGRRGHEPRNARWLIKAGKGKEAHSPQSLWKECSPANPLTLGLLTSRTVR